MKKTFVGVVAALALCIPVAAFADNGQIIALYQQLITILQQQLTFLKDNTLVIGPTSGPAPLTVTFTLKVSQGNEAIDYGDGHSSGSDGCKTIAGFCDLSKPIMHIYNLPGTYKVSLYRTVGGKASVVLTNEVVVR